MKIVLFLITIIIIIMVLVSFYFIMHTALNPIITKFANFAKTETYAHLKQNHPIVNAISVIGNL